MSTSGMQGGHALDRLDQVKHYRLALIVAPPGGEETALLRDWFQRECRLNGAVLAWVSLAEADNRPERFLADLDRALPAGLTPPFSLTQGDPSPTAFEEIRHLSQQGLEDELVDRLNQLAGSPHETYLVLEGYHVIASPGIHAAVGLLLDYLPPHVHILLTSHSEPPLPLARLRVRRQLLELGLQE